jgi:hypothetical protein
MDTRTFVAGCFLATVVLVCYPNPRAQHFVRLTEEGKIQLTVDQLRKAIQSTDTLRILPMLGKQVTIKGRTVNPRTQILSICARARNDTTGLRTAPFGKIIGRIML